MFVDPPAPPEVGETTSLRAKDLKGQVCIFQPVGEGEWPAKPATESKPAQSPQPYIECSVWTLDRAGIVQHQDGVRVSWWRAVGQLREMMGQYIAARVVEQDDRSVVLVALEGAARDVAETAIKEITAGPEDEYSDLDKPF